jgi:hypothetical protein
MDQTNAGIAGALGIARPEPTTEQRIAAALRLAESVCAKARESVSLEDMVRLLPYPEPNEATIGMGIDREWRQVRRYPADGDGYDAVVSVSRMPAHFYRVESEGLLTPLTTGSGADMLQLADTIATAIAGGMLGQDRPSTPCPECNGLGTVETECMDPDDPIYYRNCAECEGTGAAAS